MARISTVSHSKYKGVIVSKTNITKLKNGLQEELKTIVDRLIFRLSGIGEECIKKAREAGSYEDRTGNLRSSIGYVILYDGKPIKYGASEQFSGKNGKGEKGAAAAEKLLNSLQSKYPQGIVLIVCAGMQYAAYVEDVHGRDVLTSASLLMEQLNKERLSDLIE